MVFSSEAYERAFPRKPQEAVKAPEPTRPGNVLEEADKIETPAPVADPIEEPAAAPIETGGGVSDGD